MSATTAPPEETEAWLRKENERLQRKALREHAARLEAEVIAENTLREIYEDQRRLKLLQQCAAAANEATDTEDAFITVLKLVCEYSQWPVGHAYLVDEATGDLVSTQCWHLRSPERYEPFRSCTMALRFKAGTGLPGTVLANRRAEFAPNITARANFPRRAAARVSGLNSGFAFPVFVGSVVVGVLEFFAEEHVQPDLRFLASMTEVGVKLGRVIERERAQRQLQQSHDETEVLISSISTVLIGLDTEGVVTRWNSAAEHCFSLAARHALGERLGDLPLDWDWSAVQKALTRCTNQRVPVAIDDLRYAREDGKPGYLHLMVNPGWAGMTRQLDAVLVGVDITQRRQLEQKLQQVQRLEAIGELAAGVAHELNTPIQFITDNLRFVGDSIAEVNKALALVLPHAPHGLAIDKEEIAYLSGELPRAIQQSIDGAERVAAIVRAMKHHSHPGGDHIPVDLNVLAESSITIASNEWKYVAEMETQLCPNLPVAHCDGGAIGQVIINLIVNAAHAIADENTRRGRPRGRICVRTFASSTRICLSVNDDGGGIPDAVRDRIFDPFFTTKEVGKGTGQGLFIAHSTIVDKHRGALRVATTPGEGTTFTIELPQT